MPTPHGSPTAITLWRAPPDKPLLASQAAAAAEKVPTIERGKLAWRKLAAEAAVRRPTFLPSLSILSPQPSLPILNSDIFRRNPKANTLEF